MTEFDYEANIDIDVTDAYKSVTRLERALENLNDATEHGDRSLVRAEQNLKRYSKTMRQVEASAKNTAIQFTREQNQINKLAKSYEALVRAKGKAYADKVLAGDTVGAVKTEVNDRLKTEQQVNAEITKERRAFEAENARLAQEQNRRTVTEAEAARQQELNDLRKSIVQRDKMLNTAYAENDRRDRAAAAKRLRTEQQNAAAITRVWDRAQAENRRRTLNSAIPATNAAGLNPNVDILRDMRGTQEYSDLLNRSAQGLANQRYALYDVATSLTAVGAALGGSAIAAAYFGAQYDKAFASVERTTLLTGQAANDMRNELVGLSTEIPTTFQDLSAIATLGAQMNIANDNLEGFTETVATFAATTDVSVDAAATGFGRLAQLTKTPQSEISNLGSAIYQTGINAVATESQILNVAQEIATAGEIAGFTNTEIIALASAMSSLGIAPEQARGAIQRVFNDITNYAAKGGEELNSLAQTAGVSAEEFSRMWSEAPQEAFTAYLEGLGKLESAQQKMALSAQGFVNVRDINVLTRLSNNMSVYEQALVDTGEAYEANTALSEGAAIQFDNLADSATKMLNALKALATESGFSKMLNSIVKALTPVVTAIGQFVSSPVGGFISTTVASLGLLGGAIAAMTAALFMGRAALLALVTSLRANIAQAQGTTLSVRALSKELLILNASSSRAAAGLSMLAGSSATAATRTTALKGVLASVASAGGWMLAISAGVVALDKLAGAFQSAESRAEEYFASTNGAFTSGLSDAIKADTAAYMETGEALYTVEVAATESATSVKNFGAQAGAAAVGADTTTAAVDGTTTALKNNTLAIGENVAALLAQSLATDENFQKMYANADQLEQYGFRMEELTKRILADPEGGGSAYLQELSNTAQGTSQSITDTSNAAVQASAALSTMVGIVKNYEETISGSLTEQQIFNDVMAASGYAVDQTGEILEEGAESAETMGNAMSDMVDSVTASTQGLYDVQGALHDLGESLYENGNAFDAYSEAGRANMSALQNTLSTMAEASGGDAQAFAANIISMMGNLQGMGIDTGNELAFLGDMLNTLVGNQWGIDFDSSAARQDIFSFIDASIKALQTRAELERQTNAAAQQAQNMLQKNGGFLSGFGFDVSAIEIPTIDTSATDAAINSLNNLKNSINTTSSAGKSGTDALNTGFSDAAKAARDTASGAGDAADGTKKAGDAAKEAAKEFRSLADYAQDLGSVFDDQLTLSFGLEIAKDDRQDALKTIKDSVREADEAFREAQASVAGYRDNVRDARQAIADLNADLKALRSDRKVLQYQLKIAIAYGDDLRASEIEADLAQNTEEITSKQNERADAEHDLANAINELNDAQAAVVKALKESETGLKGNTEAARNNRDMVRDLIESYADELEEMAANGATKKQLTARSKEMREEFEKQLTQMGFNREEVKKYSDEFEGFETVINRMPKNVTIKGEGDMSPAKRALEKFIRDWNNKKTIGVKADVSVPKNKSVSGGTWKPSKTSPGRVSTGTIYGEKGKISGSTRGYTIFGEKLSLSGSVYAKNAYVNTYLTAGPKGPRAVATGGKITSSGDVAYRASGGSVYGLHPGGPQGTDTVPAWLTPGEWVINRKASQYYGNEFMNSINSMRFPAYLAQGTTTASSSSGNGAPYVQLVELLPNQIQQIARAVQTEILVDGRVLAKSVNSTNRSSSIRGSK